MRRRKPKTVRVSQSDIHEIERLLDDGRTEQRIVRRGRVLLAMKNPKTVVRDLCQQVGRLPTSFDRVRGWSLAQAFAFPLRGRADPVRIRCRRWLPGCVLPFLFAFL